MGSLWRKKTNLLNKQEVPECWDWKTLGGTYEIGGAIVDNEHNIELVFGDHFRRRTSDGFWIRFEQWKAKCHSNLTLILGLVFHG